jgi:hypothetical protein
MYYIGNFTKELWDSHGLKTKPQSATFHAIYIYILVLYLMVGVKVKSSQVPDMFPQKMLPIAPQFYPICFGKCCPPFTYSPVGGAKGKEL